jgi:hypothetical protein
VTKGSSGSYPNANIIEEKTRRFLSDIVSATGKQWVTSVYISYLNVVPARDTLTPSQFMTKSIDTLRCSDIRVS